MSSLTLNNYPRHCRQQSYRAPSHKHHNASIGLQPLPWRWLLQPYWAADHKHHNVNTWFQPLPCSCIQRSCQGPGHKHHNTQRFVSSTTTVPRSCIQQWNRSSDTNTKMSAHTLNHYLEAVYANPIELQVTNTTVPTFHLNPYVPWSCTQQLFELETTPER